MAPGGVMTVQRIRIDRPKTRRERPWLEDLSADPRDPDVIRAKALARAQLTGPKSGRQTPRAAAGTKR
jgi:hypothetical protein